MHHKDPSTSQELPEESELVQRLIANDQQLFMDVVRAWHPSLYGVAAAIVGHSIADEVVQEAWISVIKALSKFEGRSALKTWVTRIVANEAKNRYRKESRSVSMEAVDEHWATDSRIGTDPRFDSNGHWNQRNPAWDMSSPDELLAAKELQDCVDKHLSRLPEQQKNIMELRDSAGMEFEEICNILEVSSSNARVLLHRARDKIQQVVAKFQRTGEC